MHAMERFFLKIFDNLFILCVFGLFRVVWDGNPYENLGNMCRIEGV